MKEIIIDEFDRVDSFENNSSIQNVALFPTEDDMWNLGKIIKKQKFM